MNFNTLIAIGLTTISCITTHWVLAEESCSLKKRPKESPVSIQPEDPYASFVKKTKHSKGLMSVYLTDDGKCIIEIRADLLGIPLMISSKIAESSNPMEAMAGTMIGKPKLITFTKENEATLTLRYILSNTIPIEGQDQVNKSISRNNIDPAADQFKIVYRSANDSSYLIDVSSWMTSTSGDMGLTSDAGSTFGGAQKLSPNQSLCKVSMVKAFERNVNVKVRLSYKDRNAAPVEVSVTRSIIALNDRPMKGRKLDRRMNYFSSEKSIYDMNEDKSGRFSYIHRWDISPKPEDIASYRQGKLVEPAKPIVYYVDDAFPEKWKKYIKQGIEDWQIAFESIGFKNAIVARDFPHDDPDFDPEDIRYSCFRYITAPVANAMGPSWVDPRSGEIIQGSVYFFHDVLQLVHNWLFVQTSACNPKVREKVFDEQTMGRALRYIASHEIGHTLGLMHNMRGSSTYPVDSLRSATFTRKYGTTASIMDYARFNYIAQPGDKDVSFCPPLMGEYDIFAIKVGYAPIFEEDESATIKKWFDEKKGQDRFIYGPEVSGLPLDPSAQTEDLGDDPLKASRYGIKNLKYTMSHLVEWTTTKGYELEDLEELYAQLIRQYSNYYGHVSALIGGGYLTQPEFSDATSAVIPVAKKKQKEALQFLLNEIIDLPNWLIRKEINAKFIPDEEKDTDLQTNRLQGLIALASRVDRTNTDVVGGYRGVELLNDIYQFIWSPSRTNDRNQRNMEYNYVKILMGALGYTVQSNGGKMQMMLTRFDVGRGEYLYSASSISSAKESMNRIEYKQIFFDQLNRIRRLAQERIKISDPESVKHYRYLVHEINKALNIS